MSFSQSTDVLVNFCESLNLTGLQPRRIFTRVRSRDTDYAFSTLPRTAPDILSSACWRGYVAHFELDAAGSLTLCKYVALDKIEQPVGEQLTGDFWIELEGRGPLREVGRIRIPFASGRVIQDIRNWEGESALLAWVRMRSPPCEGGLSVGEIKWFGGINGKTGRTNNFGFVAAAQGDVYVHRSQSASAPELLTAGALVIYKRATGKSGKAEAHELRVLSEVPDEDLVATIMDSGGLRANDVLAVAVHRKMLGPFEDDLLAALALLASRTAAGVEAFWHRFTPSGPEDELLRFAPATMKRTVHRRHLAGFLTALSTLFETLVAVKTTFDTDDVYSALDDRDEQVAALWTGSSGDSTHARMLSARAAEKAVKRFYESLGSSVEDVAIRQVQGDGTDWTTHDLLVDGAIAIDVKNARRPVNGKDLYVEHTVPQFKLDRRGHNVRIAGVLSPYLQLQFIRDTSKAAYRIDDLVFLGETSQDEIQRLHSMFASASFEVMRGYERTVPHWVFGYPEASYRDFVERLTALKNEYPWPNEDVWNHVLDEGEILVFIHAMCVAGQPLPRAIASKLSGQQLRLFERLRIHAKEGNAPTLPVIYLTVLTEFLGQLKEADPNFSPEHYSPILFPQNEQLAGRSPGWALKAAYPLGAIDPLGLVRSLLATLTSLWDSREKTNLARFSSFRFGGLGILQAREPLRSSWTTLIAYCGGTAYQTDATGAVQVTPAGRPLSVKGKCGRSPLVLGRNRTCSTCGKLVCSSCGFCSAACQEQHFLELAEMEAANHRQGWRRH